MSDYVILEGDCRDRMRELVAAGTHVHTVITDPPYELGLTHWDKTGIAYDMEVWKLVHDLLYPGGIALVFGGSRTFHRIACAVEDAGFEIRDVIMWVYADKSMAHGADVDKLVDDALGAKRSQIRDTRWGNSNGTIQAASLQRLRGVKISPWITQAREQGYYDHDSDIPATPEAEQWLGWSTTLRPMYEPIIVARKAVPKGGVARSALDFGIGQYNIRATQGDAGLHTPNIVIDDSAEAQVAVGGARAYYCVKATAYDREDGLDALEGEQWIESHQGHDAIQRKNTHTTVKPTDLMRWLVRLVTKPGQTILDPFAGSGSTIKAALLDGRMGIGIELMPNHALIARHRCDVAVRIRQQHEAICPDGSPPPTVRPDEAGQLSLADIMKAGE